MKLEMSCTVFHALNSRRIWFEAEVRHINDNHLKSQLKECGDQGYPGVMSE